MVTRPVEMKPASDHQQVARGVLVEIDGIVHTIANIHITRVEPLATSASA